MKKFLIFLFSLISLISFFAFPEETKQKYDLQIYFVPYTDINKGEKIKIYDNDSDSYSNKIIESLKNAPKYRSYFLMPKNDADMLCNGYFIVNFKGEENRDISYTIRNNYMAVRNDDEAFKYDVRKEFFEYFFSKYIFETYYSEYTEKEKIGIMADLCLIDFWEWEEKQTK